MMSKEKAFTYLESKEEEMIKLIEDLVNIDSGTSDIEGVNKVAELYSSKLKEEDFHVRTVEFEEAGSSIVATKPGKNSKKVILMGHMDTVFPKGTVKERPFAIEGRRAFGPGVVDMKSGMVVALYAAKALKHIGWDEREIEVLMAGDEETGHLDSTAIDLIKERAQGAEAIFNIETGRPNGLVTERKGVGVFELHITGKAVHAGVEPENGISAIEELAHKIIEIHKLTNFETGTTLNVGIINGGTGANVVADSAYAKIDLRFVNEVEAQKTIEKIKEIAANTVLEGAKVKLIGGITFAPMVRTEANDKLYELVHKAGKELGLDLKGLSVGGGADSAFTSTIAPTVCAMGPVGGGNHSAEEYLELDTLVERAKLLVLSILNLG